MIATARSCDMVIMVLDATKDDAQRELLVGEKRLEAREKLLVVERVADAPQQFGPRRHQHDHAVPGAVQLRDERAPALRLVDEAASLEVEVGLADRAKVDGEPVGEGLLRGQPVAGAELAGVDHRLEARGDLPGDGDARLRVNANPLAEIGVNNLSAGVAHAPNITSLFC